MYKILLDQQMLNPQAIKSITELSSLPITSKQIFRGFPFESTYRSDLFKPGCYVWNETSGTTGMPFRYLMSSFYIYYKNPKYVRYADFSKFRFLAWKGMPLNYIMHNLRVAEAGIYHPRLNFQYYPLSEVNNRPEYILEKMENYKPHVLEGYTTVLIELARVQERRKQKLRIPYLNPRGEPITETQRSFLSEVFGGEVYVRYGIGETGVVGSECDSHEGFHLLEDSYIVEVVDERGVAAPPGESGRVLLTFFYNDIMPFIRYETGDIGRIVDEPCACGVPGRRIYVDGRSGVPLNFGERTIGRGQLEVLMSEFNEYVLRFQLLKTPHGKLEIRFIPTKKYTEEVGQTIVKKYLDTTGLTVMMRAVSAFHSSGAGKHTHFPDEI